MENVAFTKHMNKLIGINKDADKKLKRNTRSYYVNKDINWLMDFDKLIENPAETGGSRSGAQKGNNAK